MRGDAIALAARRHDDDRGSLVVDTDRVTREKPTVCGRRRAMARHRRRREAGQPPPRRAPGCPSPPTDGRHRERAAAPREDQRDRARRRRSGSRARRERRAHASSASARDAQTTTRARRRSGPNSRGSRFASSASDPHSCTTIGLLVASPAIAEGNQCACTISAPSAARRASRANATKKSGSASTSHFPRTQIVRNPIAVRDPVVPERCRRDDYDLESAGTQLLHCIRDESPGDVPGVSQVRGRQDDDLHAVISLRRRQVPR